MSAISLNKLSLTFTAKDGEVQALSNIDLDVEKGEFVSIIGPSGCGKTSLLRLIADLEKPSSGEIFVNGVSTKKARMERAYGYVFQSPSLFPWRTVESNILLPLQIMGYSSAKKKQHIEQVLELVGLSDFGKKYPWQLSGGMQQRASIARALIFDADILLMDEPFGALDEISRDNLNQQLLELWKKTNKTICFVTHSISEAVYLSTKIVVMSPRPGQISDVIYSNLPNERPLEIRESEPFIQLAKKVRKSLRGETLKA